MLKIGDEKRVDKMWKTCGYNVDKGIIKWITYSLNIMHLSYPRVVHTFSTSYPHDNGGFEELPKIEIE